MRGTLPLLSRAPNSSRPRSPSPAITIATPPHPPLASIPTIRLVTATPSAVGDASLPSIASPLAPRDDPTPRKRVVPKKSKLNLLGGRSKDKGKDFSDVVRRVGGGSGSIGRQFDIYVDPMNDPDIGEILMVKKKKSRAALDGMRWGALGEVTNVPSTKDEEKKKLKGKASTDALKVVDEKQKWWTIGRGRKDSKEKNKDKAEVERRARSPEIEQRPVPPVRSRSLDSNVLLTRPQPIQERPESLVPTLAPPTLTYNNLPPRAESPILLAPPVQGAGTEKTGSIAIRAMRSMRSIAHMASWAQLRNGSEKDELPKSKEKEKKKKDKEKKTKSVRSSGSSFEAGALSPEKPTRKKTSLGQPAGTMSSAALPRLRDTNRLSGSSSARTSTISSSSSLRPSSMASGGSKLSTGSSVRWDDNIDIMKEKRQRERQLEKAKAKVADPQTQETRRSLEARKRTPLTHVFPGAQFTIDNPVVTLEEATVDGHGDFDERLDEPPQVTETPNKKARARPVSDQVLGRVRPRGILGDSQGVMSILDAATADLASLINRLDLQATPGGTPDPTPHSSRIRLCEEDSPVKNADGQSPIKKAGLRSSATSLRPYSQSRSLAPGQPSNPFIGQQIAPWPALVPPLPSVQEANVSAVPRAKASVTGKPHLTHKRTLSPAPSTDIVPIFQPLRPARTKTSVIDSVPRSRVFNLESLKSSTLSGGSVAVATPPISSQSSATPGSQTFGTRPSRVAQLSSSSPKSGEDGTPSPSPVFKKPSGHVRKGSSLVPIISIRTSSLSPASTMPLAPEARQGLGLGGTMGSTGSIQPLDPEDPDSDIPDELQVILSYQAEKGLVSPLEDTLSFAPPAVPRTTPELPAEERLPEPASPSSPSIPVFHAHLTDDKDNEADLDESASSEDDTKKSFDFTGEIQKLNESGGSDRLSFVEQLENAFRSPAPIRLHGFDSFDNNLLGIGMTKSQSPESERSVEALTDEMTGTSEILAPISRDVLGKFETLDAFNSSAVSLVKERRSHSKLQGASSFGSKPSDGQLNTQFKFGGRPHDHRSEEGQDKPLTLSDIIPPLSHSSQSSNSLVEEDSSVLKSIFAKASDLPPPIPRMRLDSDSSSKRRVRQTVTSQAASHARHSSELSFAGFSSFGEVRRGFEFGPGRPAFYPPVSSSNNGHGKQESMFSIASISSYGAVLNSGSKDPFDYGQHSRATSEDMASSINDTFSFLGHPHRRKRVDSDASSFYFHAPYPTRRSHRRDESIMSVASGPPISLYNRSFGGHRRNDSSTSVSSVAQAYGLYGANGGRAAWARHRQERSLDSVMSDFSAMRLGRPGLGDKMLDSGLPLSSISASPPESVSGERLSARSSFDSIIDADRRSSMDDSLFDNTGQRTSVSSESVFGYDPHQVRRNLFPPSHFRPLSMYSVVSEHSPEKEDDTMISMLGGGHVRRRSIGSSFEASPCVRVEKRKHCAFDDMEGSGKMEAHHNSFDHARIIAKPSVDSTTSYMFGQERMTLAQRGLLARQSLENSCLSAEGEDLTSSTRSQPTFSRPGPASRPRASTCATVSSGTDTPPLSISDSSSQSSGSQSSIDLGSLDELLANVTHPLTNINMTRPRTRARGQGHRRRTSQYQTSRSSVYETIQEEIPSPTRQPPSKSPPRETSAAFDRCVGVAVVDPEPDTAELDDEGGITALRRYYALRDEVQETLSESKRLWSDTPFSIFALQSFRPPLSPQAMQALLEHSQKSYGPLPSELYLFRARSRRNSRPSPYPRAVTSSAASGHSRSGSSDNSVSFTSLHQVPLKQISINPNIISPAPAVDTFKSVSPFALTFADSKPTNPPDTVTAPALRPRVPSAARRNALGWSKRSTGRPDDNKENTPARTVLMSPNESLRISRPRPRGRPTPARQSIRAA